MALTNPLIKLAAYMSPLTVPLMRIDALRQLASEVATYAFPGPDANARKTGRASIWVKAADAAGASKEAWLETCEAYQFTAQSGIRAVERILDDSLGALRGALTPACAFGTDFVMEIEGTKRFDSLEGIPAAHGG